MVKTPPILVRRNTRELTFELGKHHEITATVAVNHYNPRALQADEFLKLELAKHGSTTKMVAVSVDREELVELAHWLLQNYDTAQGGA